MTDKTADLILFGGKVYTLDAAGTTATAIAVSKGQILAVGSDEQVEKLAGSGARRVDLAGAVVLPGLIDSHIHIPFVGGRSEAAFLYDAWSVAEIIHRLRERAQQTSGAVIGVGGNFHRTSLAEGRLPTAVDLDRVATDRPVMITDVNKTIVNNIVLCNIDTDDVPPGGEVLKDSSGKPQGGFLYAAKQMTPLGGQGDVILADISTEEAIIRGLESAARLGLTGVLDAWADLETIAAFRAVERQRGLLIRVSAMPFDAAPSELEQVGITAGLNEGRLTIGPIKLLFDLFVMHKTALMYEPYVGQAGNFGMSQISQEELQRRIDEAFGAGWPVGIHTTGDRGIDIVASAVEKGIEKAGGPPGRCHLIHVYFPTDKALDIAGRCGLAIAAQPTFIRTWGETVRAFVGQGRAERFKPLRTMLDRGLIVGGGADSPITWHNPWIGIYAAATRKTEGGRILGEKERITVEEALRCYTLGSAAILEEERIRGSIEVGKLADFTVIDRDILAIDLEHIPATKVLKTIVGGEVAYEA
ncbi:MAG: amidohydrolase [Chloroflexi bacterium]|nr:amidohydrolase [Chloroflexota bacterium]